MHQNGIIHGDLAGTNVLINDSGRACIAGFDVFSIMETPGLQGSETPLGGGTIRFQAPELIDPDSECLSSVASDVYAFGMMCYQARLFRKRTSRNIFSKLEWQIITDHVPFPDVKHDFTVMLKVLKGEHPIRPSDPLYLNRGLTENMWKLLQDCWHRQPENRPDMSQVIPQLPEVDQRRNEVWGDLAPSQLVEANVNYGILDGDELSAAEMSRLSEIISL